MKRLFKIAAMASAITCVFLLFIWPVSYFLDLSKNFETSKLARSDSLPLISDYHLGFENGAAWLYNGGMPYRGGIISLSGGTNTPQPISRSWSWGDCDFGHKIEFEGHNRVSMITTYSDLPGIYFRQFLAPSQRSAWTTLRVNLWYLILLSAILPIVWISRHVRLRKKLR
jgi:hypothetical protein